MLYTVALKLTRNPADAEDLTQNTVVKALRFHDKFQKGTYIKAWLLTILRNTFINDHRRKTRRPLLVELNGSEVATQHLPDPSIEYKPVDNGYEALQELLGDEVKEALASLPKDFREAIIMADMLDMSYKEIAEKINCPIGTVMSRLYRGRRLLRKQLSQYAEEQGVLSKK